MRDVSTIGGYVPFSILKYGNLKYGNTVSYYKEQERA